LVIGSMVNPATFTSLNMVSSCGLAGRQQIN
jgi:hypothetical protein